MSRYDKFYDNVWNSETQSNQKGLLNIDLKDVLSFNDDIIYEIPSEHQYRPDRIAQSFYGNFKLFWVLIYVNDISDSPEGFFTGRKIRVPRMNRVLEVT